MSQIGRAKVYTHLISYLKVYLSTYSMHHDEISYTGAPYKNIKHVDK